MENPLKLPLFRRWKDTLTQQECDDFLEWELQLKANVINREMKGILIHQAMFDAQVDFAYNKGVELYENCDLLKAIKANPNDPRIYDFQIDPKTGWDVPLSCKFLGCTISNGKRQPGLVNVIIKFSPYHNNLPYQDFVIE